MASQFRLPEDIPQCIPVPFKTTWNIYNCCKVGSKLRMRNKVVELQSSPTGFAYTGSSFHNSRRKDVPYIHLNLTNITHICITALSSGLPYYRCD
jgi:hypothetical protein